MRASLVVLLTALSSASIVRADEPIALPKASGLVLDGRLSESGWAGAARIAVSPVTVSARRGEEPPGGTTREIRPEDVRLLVADGQLWIGAEIREDVGLGTGVKGMLAWPGTASAADAFSFAFL